MSNTTTRKALITDLHMAGKGAISTLSRKSLADLQALAASAFGTMETPEFRVENRPGGWVHVFDAEGRKVAIVRRSFIPALATAKVGEELRKYVPLEADNGIVKGWAPIDESKRAEVFQVLAAA